MNLVFNPTGTSVHKQALQVRLDIFPESTEKSYAKNYVSLPVFPNPSAPLGGYPGKIVDGSPQNQAQYDNWVASLPHIWQLNPALCVFVTVPQNIDKALLGQWIDGVLKADEIATIDDIMGTKLGNETAHYISPFMRNKTTLLKQPVLTFDDQMRDEVNAVLAGFTLDGQKGGKVLDVTPGTIVIGPGATDRESSSATSSTRVDANVASTGGTGTIDTWELWFVVSGVNVQVATFFVVSGNNLSTRDTETIGAVTAGSKQTFTGLSTDVQNGDYPGVYDGSVGVTIERANSGATQWTVSGDKIPCTNQAFGTTATETISIYGTGTAAGGGTVVPVFDQHYRMLRGD